MNWKNCALYCRILSRGIRSQALTLCLPRSKPILPSNRNSPMVLVDLVKNVANHAELCDTKDAIGAARVLTKEELRSIKESPETGNSPSRLRLLWPPCRRRKVDPSDDWAAVVARDAAVDHSYIMTRNFARLLDFFLVYKHAVLGTMRVYGDGVNASGPRPQMQIDSADMEREQLNCILNFKVLLSGSVIDPNKGSAVSSLPCLRSIMNFESLSLLVPYVAKKTTSLQAELDLLLSAVLASTSPRVQALIDDQMALLIIFKPLIDALSREAVSILLIEFLKR
eukprot:Gregarina_sp_Poly_1__10377@NODE_743_length_6482_cov_29_105846_g554_i0_p2_GENE_NODE_743_length_6482_cov_29_105846_g554_i0NODE_743_length_6482_cov_29_105846_g554_i0_p2_ORF_typecomplete_len282_score38_32_NODE_743_length_6482_cov_29_105846_g554_i044955340